MRCEKCGVSMKYDFENYVCVVFVFSIPILLYIVMIIISWIMNH